MIRRHDFNSEWWGKDVGVISDGAFFELPLRDRSSALQPFAWVEFAQPASRLPSRFALAAAGFFQADTQIRFRLDMRNIPLTQCARQLVATSAAESPFEIPTGDIHPFCDERFSILTGENESRLTARYSLWASRLIDRHPTTCLRLSLDGATQGWFLAQQDAPGLQLTLAMLSTQASISGHDHYACAISHFAKTGHRLGFASFSVRNVNVFNIYSRLGARFLEPRECWMWIANNPHSLLK